MKNSYFIKAHKKRQLAKFWLPGKTFSGFGDRFKVWFIHLDVMLVDGTRPWLGMVCDRYSGAIITIRRDSKISRNREAEGVESNGQTEKGR